MSPSKFDPHAGLSKDLLEALDRISGPHPGFRPAHAKGVLLSGVFRPGFGAKELTKAPHAMREWTPVTVRFSDSSGMPNVADNSAAASPRGVAIRFHLAEHEHTDIIGHSTDGFPVRTAEEFLEFLRAVPLSGPGAQHPTPLEQFLASHPKAMEFVKTPKPVPVSFAAESYFSVTAHRFTNGQGESRYGRYRIVPEAGNRYLDEEAAAAKPANFLLWDIEERVARGPVRFQIRVQVAESGDTVDDATVRWPAERRVVEFGDVELTSMIPASDENARRIIFDPIPRVDGIEASGDPLLEPRASVYLMSGRRRRSV
jgi:catalase